MSCYLQLPMEKKALTSEPCPRIYFPYRQAPTHRPPQPQKGDVRLGFRAWTERIRQRRNNHVFCVRASRENQSRDGCQEFHLAIFYHNFTYCTRPRPAGESGIFQFHSPRAGTHAGTLPSIRQVQFGIRDKLVDGADYIVGHCCISASVVRGMLCGKATLDIGLVAGRNKGYSSYRIMIHSWIFLLYSSNASL